MSSVQKTAGRDQRLAERMALLGVSEADIDETFVRSGGHGGQNVNKTSTCVMIVHKPTGLQVKCQDTRTQGANRFLARMLLLDKLEARRKSAAEAQRSAKEKARRKNRPRSYAAKQRVLAEKSRRSLKKSLRRMPPD